MTATAPNLDFDPILLPRPITVRAAPRREPPFDDEIDGRDGQSPPRSWVHTGAQPLPFEAVPAPVAVRGHHRSWALGSTAAGTAEGAMDGAAELPDPAGWSRRLFVALLEARVGLRPLRQLSGYLSPAVSAGLAAELARELTRPPGQGGRPRAATVTSIHVCEPADRVAEVSAVICAGTRYRAIAARLEAQDGRWRCVRLQFG